MRTEKEGHPTGRCRRASHPGRGNRQAGTQQSTQRQSRTKSHTQQWDEGTLHRQRWMGTWSQQAETEGNRWTPNRQADGKFQQAEMEHISQQVKTGTAPHRGAQAVARPRQVQGLASPRAEFWGPGLKTPPAPPALGGPMKVHTWQPTISQTPSLGFFFPGQGLRGLRRRMAD